MNKSLRFLIVDDHLPSRATLKIMVTTHVGWEVIGEAEDGQTAVAMAAAYRPDVILMDIDMPVMNGLLATRQIKAMTPQTKMILFSGHAQPEFRQGSREAGGDYFLQKEQLTTKVLAEIVNQILNRQDKENTT